ncbi:MAG: Smr/MutS family protein [bacterium]
MADNEPPEDDKSLFLAAIGEVKRVTSDRVVHDKEKPKPVPKQFIKDEEAVLQDMLSDNYLDIDVQAEDVLDYCSPGLQKTAYRKLRRGEYRCEDEIDLHGYTVDQARTAFSQFLNRCREQDVRSVRIIHGKGYSSVDGPQLKARVNSWLRQRGDVIAFHSARPADGGTGAVYVLLKSARKG